MLRKFNVTTDSELIVAGEVEAHANSFPGAPMPPGMVTSRISSIRNGHCECTVLDEDGPKGYVVFTRKLSRSSVQLYVHSIYLEPSVRGQGKLEALFDSMRDPSVPCTIDLDVSLSNASAVTAYEGLGFETQRLRMSKHFPPKQGG